MSRFLSPSSDRRSSANSRSRAWRSRRGTRSGWRCGPRRRGRFRATSCVALFPALRVELSDAHSPPGPQAIAVSESLEYTLVRPASSPSSLLVVASDRLSFLSELLSTPLEPLARFPGSSLLSTTYTDPLSSPAPSPSRSVAPAFRQLIPASYVTSTTGTGLVHTAPAHGLEDWDAWRAYRSSRGLPPAETLCAVDAAGRLDDTLFGMVESGVAERLRGKDVLKEGTGEVIEVLRERGRLLREVEVQHKFPYDWRTKKPVIFRCAALRDSCPAHVRPPRD